MKPPSRVKKLACIVFTIGMLLLSGCIDMEHDLRMAADGSADYQLSYSISEQAVSQFRAMLRLTAELAEAAGHPHPRDELDPLLQLFLDPNEADIRLALESLAEAGISIRSLRQETRGNRRHINLHLDIDTIDQLAHIPFFREYGFSLSQTTEGLYQWDRRPMQTEGVPTPFSEYERANIAPLMDGFRVAVNVTVPGRIMSTTAARTALQRATWEFAFNRNPMAVQSLLHQHFRIVFDSSGRDIPLVSIVDEEPTEDPQP